MEYCNLPGTGPTCVTDICIVSLPSGKGGAPPIIILQKPIAPLILDYYLDDPDLFPTCNVLKWIGSLSSSTDCAASRDKIQKMLCPYVTAGSCGADFDQDPNYFRSSLACCDFKTDSR